MTENKTFKHLVRTRMNKTGESYAAARAALMASGPETTAPTPATPTTTDSTLATSDANIRERTGRGWEEWFDLLDAWGAADRTHRDVAKWVASGLGIVPLAWNAQAITGSYERARGLRAVGEHADGFSVSVQKTLGSGVSQVFAAFTEDDVRGRWLDGVELTVRTSTPDKVAHFDTSLGDSRVHVWVTAKSAERTTVSLQHARLADSDEADRMRAFWRSALMTLGSTLAADGREAGGSGA